MPKQILNTSKKLGVIRKLIENLNYDNIQAIVSQNMDESEKMYLSKVFDDGNNLQWYIDDNSNVYKNFEKATESEKEEIYNKLFELNQKSKKIIERNGELSGFVEKILSIPSEDCIYFSKQQNILNIILTKWGYVPVNTKFNNDVITTLIQKRKPKNDIKLHFKYKTGDPIINTPFYLKKGESVELQTDVNGSYNLLYIPIATEMQIALDPNFQKDVQTVVVQEYETNYPLIFPFYTQATIRVVDQFDALLSNYTIDINDEQFITDENAQIILKSIDVDKVSVLKIKQLNNEENVSNFSLQKDFNNNNFIFKAIINYDCELNIITKFEDGTLAHDYPLQINDSQRINSGSNAIANIPNCNVGDQMHIVDWNNSANQQTLYLEKGTNNIEFIVAKPIQEFVRIGIIDHDKKPIKGIELKINQKNVFEEVQETNMDGFCFYPKEKFVDKQKVFSIIKGEGINGKKKEVTIKKNFVFDSNKSEYILQIKKRSWKWLWLLLLLLLIPLFFNFEKTINVHAVTMDGKDYNAASVHLQYTSRYLYKKGEFFKVENFDETQETNEKGIAKFEKIGFSGFSFIFYMFSKMTIEATGECYIGDATLQSIFHFKKNEAIIPINMKEEMLEIQIKVIDAEIESPVVDAEVISYYKVNGKSKKITLKTNADGVLQLKDVAKCGVIDSVVVNKYGYQSETKKDIQIGKILGETPNLVFYLTPIKKKITFFVKNKFTKEPLPDAVVTLKLNDPRTNQSTEEEIRTNLDGMGVGFYDDLFLGAKVEISAECKYFKSDRIKGKYTVEEFINLPDSLRTIYLEPEQFVVSFRNIDSLSLKPIAGILNKIEVLGQDGKTYKDEQISNRNGVFNVQARKGDKVKILSLGDIYYFDKNTELLFEKELDILMKVKSFDLDFKTIENLNNSLLSECNLDVFINGNRIPSPSNSGNGNFKLKLLATDVLSIVSRHEGYLTNDKQINNKTSVSLIKDSKLREILMEMEPCQGGGNQSNQEPFKNSIKEHDMKIQSGEFLFEYNTDTEADLIEVYNGRIKDISKANLIFTINEATGSRISKSVKLIFTNRVVTVKIISNSRNWDYKVNCPN